MRPAVFALAAMIAAPVMAAPKLDYSFSYPAVARAIPGLRASLDRENARERARMTHDFEESKREAMDGRFPAPGYSYDKSWKVVADTPAALSLSAEGYQFTGGAHGSPFSDSLLWDRRAGVRRQVLDLFDRTALRRATQAKFCEEIDRQRTEKRGERIVRSREIFTDCIDPVAQTVIVGSRSRARFDRIGFLVGPYEAGPYAEGTYEVTLPVTPAILATVLPRYRSWFTAR